MPRHILEQPLGWPAFRSFLQAISPQLTHLGLHVGGVLEADIGINRLIAILGLARLIDETDEVYGIIFQLCAELKTVCLTFGRSSDGAVFYEKGWCRLVEAMSHLPRSVHAITIELVGVGTLRHGIGGDLILHRLSLRSIILIGLLGDFLRAMDNATL